MTLVFHIGLGLGVIILLTDLILLIRWLHNFKPYHYKPSAYPLISILVAARNEEKTIEACLSRLISIDYPADKMEILVGNDRSEDRTLQIAGTLAEKDSRIKLLDIKSNLGLARGKANVLAHLAKKARGQLFFITDADTRVPEQWVKNLLYGLHNNVGIISGVTVVIGKGLWAQLQNMEWLNALGMLKVVTDMGIPVTGIGNNMMVTREAYEKVGGYENIPFSVVEDFQLTRAVLQAKFSVINLFNAEVTAETIAKANIKDILNQRKRWMNGAVKIPLILKLILVAQALTVPLTIILLFYNIIVALSFFLLKVLLRSTFSFFVYKKVKQKINFGAILLYDFYAGLLTTMTLIYYIIPVKLDWKGRKY